MYGRELISDRSDVILILDPSTPDSVSHYTDLIGGDPMAYESTPYDWICANGRFRSATCDVSTIASDPDNWRVRASDISNANNETLLRVEYCLSKRTQEHCRLILSIPMLAVVVGCNALKLGGMIIAWLCLEERPLLTLGGIKPSQKRTKLLKT